MANEMNKVPCGGFKVGGGLSVEDKILKQQYGYAIVNEGFDIKWDGNTEGRDIIQIQELGLVKVSDDYIPLSMLKDFYTVTPTPTKTFVNFVSDATEYTVLSGDDGSYLIIGDGSFGYLKEGKQNFHAPEESVSIEVPSTGFYFMTFQGGYVSRLYKPTSYDIAQIPGEFTTLEGGYINSFDQVASLLFSGKININEWKTEEQ